MSQTRFMFNPLLLSSLVILLRFPFVTQAQRSKFSRPYGFAGLSPCHDLTFHTIGGFFLEGCNYAVVTGRETLLLLLLFPLKQNNVFKCHFPTSGHDSGFRMPQIS